MSHKYVLVSIYYDGDEPKMYGPETDDLDDLTSAISVETKLTKALEKASWNSGVEWVDLAFIQDGKAYRRAWKRWTWLNALSLAKYFAWRMFIATWKLLNKLAR